MTFDLIWCLINFFDWFSVHLLKIEFFIWTEEDTLSQMATILSIPLGLKSASLEIMRHPSVKDVFMHFYLSESAILKKKALKLTLSTDLKD